MTDPQFLIATYQLTQSGIQLDKAKAIAEKIALGQTLGTSAPDTVQKLSAYAGRVNSVQLTGNNMAELKVAFPVPEVIHGDIAMMLSITFGKISMLGNLKLLDLDLPEILLKKFPGPGFGVDGIRKLTGEKKNPMLMSIFKPCVGLKPSELADMLEKAALGGCHFLMDDELLSDEKTDSALKRLEACLNAIEKAEKKTGHKLIYAPHLTGPAMKLNKRAEKLHKNGAQALLFSYLCYGLPLLESLRNNDELILPLLGHPALAGAMYSGVSEALLFGLLPRLAGCDMVLSPSPYGNVSISESAATEVANKLSMPLGKLKPALPVPSAGIQSTMVPDLMKLYGNDCVINAGTGIFDNASGPKSASQEFLALIAAQEVKQKLAATK